MTELFDTPIHVIELGDSISASAAGMFLRELGAHVTKVEPPEGSPLKRVAPFLGSDEVSALYTYLNRGKQTVTADLASAEGRETVEGYLAEACDVVLMSGTRDEWASVGLTTDRMRSLAPRAVVGRISRYGDDGPHRDLLGDELQFQALGGLMYVIGIEGREPLRMGGNVMQYAAGAALFTGALLGLYNRQATGSGAVFVTSVFELVPYLEWKNALSYQADGLVARRGDEGMAPVILPCKDGFSAFYYRPIDWANVKKLLEDPRLDAEEFATQPLRQQHRIELTAILAETTSRLEKRELYHRAQRIGLPIGYIATMGDLLESDQYLARAWLEEVDLGELGRGIVPGTPFRVIDA
jgi:crotonobetainyl-CoA:carnitine CoA-transferase CaiB-like acyl-CoA transferase